MDNKKLTTDDISEFVDAFNTLFSLLKDIDPGDDDDDWCDCDNCDCDDCDDCDNNDDDDETVYRLTEKAIMMLVLKDFGIDVSLDKADKIYKALMDDLDKAGYVEHIKDEKND